MAGEKYKNSKRIRFASVEAMLEYKSVLVLGFNTMHGLNIDAKKAKTRV